MVMVMIFYDLNVMVIAVTDIGKYFSKGNSNHRMRIKSAMVMVLAITCNCSANNDIIFLRLILYSLLLLFLATIYIKLINICDNYWWISIPD